MSVVKLPLSTVKLINSSQVITSLSSVIKELMENAVDAGAKNIEIKLEKHGFEKIEVRDDGCGINCSDIQYVCLPSYTSKITGFSDLEKLCCYGFRGEALSSLCAVSQVSITTKTVDDDVATCYSFNSSGQVISCKASHLPKGTTVCASELFKGLPVRKKLMSFSQRASEELRKLENVVKSIAVIHPRLRVTITHNKFLIWQKTSISNLRQSMTQVFTQSVVTRLHQIHYSNELMELEMMIPKRDCDVSSLCFSSLSDALYIFINKRIVVDKKIYKVVMDELTQYFGHYLPASKYPICIIILTVPANSLDINLEPNKSRVLLQYMVSSALKNEDNHLEGQVNCADVRLIERMANDKVRNQLINEELLSCTEGFSKLKSKVLTKKCNQDICVKDHVVENENICNIGAQVANIDREEKIVQKHNESVIIEKKYIEIEIDFSEFQPFTYSNFYETDMCTMIGQLEASPLWVYCRNNEIGVTSVIRLHEAVQFHKNLESMSIPIKMLESNISIKEGDLGSALWNVLLSFKKQDHCVADERITKNGFVIEISDDGVDNIRATITYTALHIAYYGLDELIELLQMIRNQDKSLSLLHFRPLKVISYIRSETMRQCYFSTPSFENESVSELLYYWFMYVRPNCGSCIHHKQVVLPLPT